MKPCINHWTSCQSALCQAERACKHGSNAEASPGIAGPSGALALAPCYLSVPAGELEDLYAYFVREMHDHEQIAAALTRKHQTHERSKRTGKADACHDASVRVRLLIDRAKERQPTDNKGDLAT